MKPILTILLLCVSAPLCTAVDKPNIIFILADDLGYAELGCYGQKWIKTPHIDKIAAEGIKFTQHYSGQAVCAPCRYVLMTGKHPGHAYIRDNGDPKDGTSKTHPFPGQNPIPESEVTIAEHLKGRGYATAAIGKWGLGHFGTSGDPNRQGFDLFFGYNCQRHAHNHFPKFLWRNNQQIPQPGNTRKLDGAIHSQDAFTAEALSFIRANKDKPFFLYLPFAIPHLSIQTTGKWLEKYKGVIPEEDHVHRGYLKHPFPRAGYAAMVSMMDDAVGQVTSLVKQLGIDDNTLVVFTSDNGPTYNRLGGSDSDFFRSAGVFKGLKGSLYEGGIRIPMVARWPGRIKPATTSEHISAFWDWLPTLCEVSGAKPPANTDGISLLAALTGKTQKPHEFLYWEFPSYGSQQVVRMGDWKGVRQSISKAKTSAEIKTELYNLKSDPGETINVAARRPGVIAKIEAIMAQEHTPSSLFPILPEERRSKRLSKRLKK
jgi:arylsulfatase A